MPEGSKKSRSRRRVFKKTPTGRTALHYEKKKPGKARCSRCGAMLAGIPNKRAVNMQNMGKTEKRPSRPYGGMLCSRCMRALLKEKVRLEK